MRILILFFGVLLCVAGVFAAVEDAATQVGNSGQYTGSSQGLATAQGGNTSYVNLSANTNTDKWQGFYGDVTGSLRLGDGASILYDFGVTTFQAVFASSNDSVDFATVTGLAGAPAQATADTHFGFTNEADNITQVVDDLAVCTAGTEIVGAGAITTLNSSGGDWAQDTCFAGANAAPSSIDEYVWGTDIVGGGAASFIAGLDVEYQMMVPVVGAGDVFYFYLEI